MREVTPLSNPYRSTNVAAPSAATDTSSRDFGEHIENAIDQVNEMQTEADEKVQRFMKGEDVPIHDVMVELGKAETSLRLMTTAMQKVIQAYNEIARMQV